MLLSSAGTVKLADFGSACWSGPLQHHANFSGTLTNLAPEALPRVNMDGSPGSPQPYLGRPVDIWAAGVTPFEMLAGLPPFRGSTLTKLFAAIEAGLSWHHWRQLDTMMGWLLRDVFVHVFRTAPELRSSARQACQILEDVRPSASPPLGKCQRRG